MRKPDPMRPAHEPTHPGAILREDVLPALGLSVTEVARHLGVTPEMALRLGKLCGNGPGFWLRMQQARDLWRAERDLAGVVAAIPTLRAA